MNLLNLTTKAAVVLLVSVCILSIVACGPVKGYPGATRPAADVATLRANPFWSDILVTVRAVDGLKVNSQIELALLPGERTLTIDLGPCSLQSLSQAGRQNRQMLGMTNAQWRTTTTMTVSVEAGVEYAFGGRWSEPEYTVEFQRDEDRSVLVTKRVTGTKGSY